MPFLCAAVVFASLFYGLFRIFYLLATEVTQGYVQKIFFIHVPSAFAMYITLITAALAGLLYLIERKESYDHLSRGALQASFVFALAVMITGPIWAKPIWGTYWAWDPRLTATLIIFLVICATLAVRKVFDSQSGKIEAGRKLGALLSIIGVLDIPLIHWSVTLWRGVHPTVIRQEGGLTPEFRSTLVWMALCLISLSLLTTFIFYKILEMKSKINQLRHQSLRAER